MAGTATDDGFHEIQLNGKQLVFLFMAVTVVSVVIFLCGVLVGRGVRLDRAAPDVLEAQQTAVAPPPAAPAVTAPGAGAPATAGEDLSYPGRLADKNPPKEQLKDPAAQQPISAPPASVAASAAPAAPPATSSAATTAGKPAPAATPAAPAEPAGSGIAIQLAALGKREEADIIARRLVGKGYPAYVLNPESGAPAVFRVRVGKFKDRREAESIAARLQKEEQFKPWIVH